MDDFYDDYDYEPSMDFGYEHESAMASAGWGTDEDYGYFGDADEAGYWDDREDDGW